MRIGAVDEMQVRMAQAAGGGADAAPRAGPAIVAESDGVARIDSVGSAQRSLDRGEAGLHARPSLRRTRCFAAYSSSIRRSRGRGPRRGRRRGAACGCRHSSRPAEILADTPAPPCAWIASSMILSAMLRRVDLDHRDLGGGGLVAGLVHHVGGLEAQQPRHSMSIRAAAMRCSQTLCAGRSACRTRRGSAAAAPSPRSASSADADRAHAMVDAARPEPALRDLEAAPFAEQHRPKRGRARPSARFPYGRAARRHSRRR